MGTDKSDADLGKDVADNQRAAEAGTKDGKSGTYDSEGKLGSDTEGQKSAYNTNYRAEADKG